MPGTATSQASFVERLEAAGLGARAEALTGLVRPSIRLRPSPPDEQAGQRAGATRLGGVPDLPPSTAWPAHRDVPQSFVAQIDLAEAHPFDRDALLPDRGLLSFFYDSEQRVWGFDPAERGAWAVVHTPEDVEIAPRDFPTDLPEGSRFSPVPLRPEPETTYPPLESSELEALGLSAKEREAYAEVWLALQELAEGEGATVHRLLGHPDPIQGDMQLECQLVTHGLYCGDPSGYRDPRAEELRPGAVDWRLLLQIDSEEDAGTMWGDAGCIYFWLHREALAARSWDETWFVLQCF